jgi:hypothetical protein
MGISGLASPSLMIIYNHLQSRNSNKAAFYLAHQRNLLLVDLQFFFFITC